MKFWRKLAKASAQHAAGVQYTQESEIEPGEWESHPCLLPMITPYATEDPLLIPCNGVTVAGRVWRCHCGRRWLLEYVRYDKDTGVSYSASWVEQMSSEPIAEAEFEDLLRGDDDAA